MTVELKGCTHSVVDISGLEQAPQYLYKGFSPLIFFIFYIYFREKERKMRVCFCERKASRELLCCEGFPKRTHLRWYPQSLLKLSFLLRFSLSKEFFALPFWCLVGFAASFGLLPQSFGAFWRCFWVILGRNEVFGPSVESFDSYKWQTKIFSKLSSCRRLHMAQASKCHVRMQLSQSTFILCGKCGFRLDIAG